jgi:hypothetical protein
MKNHTINGTLELIIVTDLKNIFKVCKKAKKKSGSATQEFH